MNFDEIIDRKEGCGASSSKWQNFAPRFPGLDTTNALPMWVADMDFRVPEEVTDAMANRVAHGIFGYVCPDEVLKFATSCADWLQRRHGLSVDPEDMLFTPGVLCGLNAAIQEFTNEGDGVIIHTPVYYPFSNGVNDNKRVIRRNPLIEKTGQYHMDYENLEQLAQDPRNKLMVISSPHNPGGRVWSAEELARMAEICIRHNVLIFSDEIHCDLVMPGVRHTPLPSLGKEIGDHSIVSYSPSKTFNLAGLCASLQLVQNSELRMRLHKRLVANRIPRANIFGLVAGEAAYTHGDRYADEVVAYIYSNIQFFIGQMQKIPGVRVMEPEGTYLLWVDFKGTGLDEEQIYQIVIEEAKVAGDLGKWFGPGGEGFVRFNLACPKSIVAIAAERMQAAFAVR